MQVVNGDKAWRSENGQTQEATGHNLTELQEDLYFQRIETLLPLITDAGFRLSPADEAMVNGRTAVGINVASEGHRDVTLYFEQETFWLVKSVHLLPDLTGKELFRETVFSDFRDIDGSKQFAKMGVHQDGKKVLDAKLIEIKFMDKIDTGVFGRP